MGLCGVLSAALPGAVSVAAPDGDGPDCDGPVVAVSGVACGMVGSPADSGAKGSELMVSPEYGASAERVPPGGSVASEVTVQRVLHALRAQRPVACRSSLVTTRRASAPSYPRRRR